MRNVLKITWLKPVEGMSSVKFPVKPPTHLQSQPRITLAKASDQTDPSYIRAPFISPRTQTTATSSLSLPETDDIVIPVVSKIAGSSGHPKEISISLPPPPPSSSFAKDNVSDKSTQINEKHPNEMIRELAVETRERFYKTPTLSPYLRILMMLTVKTKQSPVKVVERFLKEYDSLVKNQPRMANILAYQKIRGE